MLRFIPTYRVPLRSGKALGKEQDEQSDRHGSQRVGNYWNRAVFMGEGTFMIPVLTPRRTIFAGESLRNFV
jgi:hypothetical protein